jgi:hypothetical protein
LLRHENRIDIRDTGVYLYSLGRNTIHVPPLLILFEVVTGYNDDTHIFIEMMSYDIMQSQVPYKTIYFNYYITMILIDVVSKNP